MTEFVNMFKNYANFTARTTKRGYWKAVLFFVIATFVISILSAFIGPQIPSGVTLENIDGVWVAQEAATGLLAIIWSLATFIPVIAMAIRRLRDAGKKWTWIFIELVPLAGFIILIVLLCKPSVEDNGVPVV
ncbi:MAG: DUF805 domain-containing protein [Oscillospiraceae bacterium]|nr:DUF805 domain-containing protein [Oscillospiraceae bacterium]